MPASFSPTVEKSAIKRSKLISDVSTEILNFYFSISFIILEKQFFNLH